MRHHPLKFISLIDLRIKTVTGRQFGWGGTLLKQYQQGPKVNSFRLEIGKRVQEQKLA
jgi:hypothetical protein